MLKEGKAYKILNETSVGYDITFYVSGVSNIAASVFFDIDGDTFLLYRKWDGCSHLNDFKYYHFDSDGFEIGKLMKIASHVCDLAMYDYVKDDEPDWTPNCRDGEFIYKLGKFKFEKIKPTEVMKKYIKKEEKRRAKIDAERAANPIIIPTMNLNLDAYRGLINERFNSFINPTIGSFEGVKIVRNNIEGEINE